MVGDYHSFVPPCAKRKSGAQKQGAPMAQMVKWQRRRGVRMGGGHATGMWRTPFLLLRMRACAGEWKPPQQCAVPVAARLHPLPWLSAGVKHNNGQSGNGKPRASPFSSLPCDPLPAPAPTHNPRAPTRGHHPKCIPCSARAPLFPALCTTPPTRIAPRALTCHPRGGHAPHPALPAREL